MSVFEHIHASAVTGSLTMFDRLIFKGHRTRLFQPDALRAFLWTQGFPLTQWTKFVTAATEAISLNAQALASQAGRPYIHLEGLATRSATSKEGPARGIAQRDGVVEGLVCVLWAVEPCRSFDIRRNHRTHQLEISSNGAARWVTSAMKVAIFAGMQHGAPVHRVVRWGRRAGSRHVWRTWHGVTAPSFRIQGPMSQLHSSVTPPPDAAAS